MCSRSHRNHHQPRPETFINYCAVSALTDRQSDRQTVSLQALSLSTPLKGPSNYMLHSPAHVCVCVSVYTRVGVCVCVRAGVRAWMHVC